MSFCEGSQVCCKGVLDDGSGRASYWKSSEGRCLTQEGNTVAEKSFCEDLESPDTQRTEESFVLTNCEDSYGDDPSTPGITQGSWDNEGLDPKHGRRGSSGVADTCSFHYWYALRYAGERIKRGESILVEGVCPQMNVQVGQPGEVQEQLMKFYKCDCAQ